MEDIWSNLRNVIDIEAKEGRSFCKNQGDWKHFLPGKKPGNKEDTIMSGKTCSLFFKVAPFHEPNV